MGCGKAFKKLILPIAGIALAIFAPEILPAVFGSGAGEAAVGGALAEGGLATSVGGGLLAGEGALGSALAGAGVEGLAGASTAGFAGAAAGSAAGATALGATGAAAAGAGLSASSGISGLLSGLTVKDALSGVQAVSSLMSGTQKQPKPVAADETPQQQVTAPKTQAETLYQQQLSPNSQNLSANIGGGTGVGNMLAKTSDKDFAGNTLLAQLFGDKKKLGATGKLA